MSAAIRAQGLRFHYPGTGGRPGFGIELADWTLPAAGSAVLYGPSGCGKSTLLNLISGALAPQAGSLQVNGLDMAAASDAARREHRIRSIGFVFQDYPLVPYLDAEENVLFPYRLNPALVLTDEARRRARSLLAQLGLGDKHKRRPQQLSQGERQRVAIARALVTQPQLLLADEPTAGLDPANSNAVIDLLESLRAELGLALLVVTHDHSLLDRFDDRLDMAPLARSAGEGAP